MRKPTLKDGPKSFRKILILSWLCLVMKRIFRALDQYVSLVACKCFLWVFVIRLLLGCHLVP